MRKFVPVRIVDMTHYFLKMFGLYYGSIAKIIFVRIGLVDFLYVDKIRI